MQDSRGRLRWLLRRKPRWAAEHASSPLQVARDGPVMGLCWLGSAALDLGFTVKPGFQRSTTAIFPRSKSAGGPLHKPCTPVATEAHRAAGHTERLTGRAVGRGEWCVVVWWWGGMLGGRPVKGARSRGKGHGKRKDVGRRKLGRAAQIDELARYLVRITT